MIDSYTPTSTRLQRGSAGLTKALRLSTLLPQEQAAISSILQSLNEADEQMNHRGSPPVSDAYAASLLATVLDNYRKQLSGLGGRSSARCKTS